MEEKLVKGFTYERGDVRSLAKETDDQPSAVSDDELPTLSLPIKIRGQFIGTLVAHKSEDDLNWTVEEKALMTTLVEQLAATLESARLYEDTQRRVAREQIVGKVAGRMRESLDMETVMQTALQEIGDALDISKIKLRMRDVENL
jgi:GAF domain-containing protein